MKKAVIRVLKKALKEKGIDMKADEIEKLVEMPSSDFGDYAFPCFFLSEKLKDEPREIAKELRRKIGEPQTTEFEDIQTKGPYINFILNRKSLARQVVWDAITKKKNFGKTNIGKRKKIVVEFSSPNIAKPFGISHLRSTIIGNSLANIFEFQNFKVIRVNYLGDWGTQFGRLLFGYEKFGNQKDLEKDPMNYLFKIYVRASKKKYDENARDKFKKLEEKDRGSLLLWRIFRNLSIADFKKIYKKLGIKFDVYEGESDYRTKTNDLLKKLEENNLLKKSKKAEIIDLTDHGLETVVAKKSDGTTIYITRDLVAAIERQKKYRFEKMVYEVGQDQKLYFKQLFKILELMGYKWVKNCKHVDHGLYLDKTGKRFATRKGKTIFMENILNETISLAKKEIKKRAIKIKQKDLEERAHKLAIAAIFYGDLKNNRSNNIVFDIKKFLSFEGDTGPYILYSYVRASSILKKATSKGKFKVYDLEKKELELVKKLYHFQEVVFNAGKNLNPSLIANYSYQLAQTFTEFYHNCKVIGSKQEPFRLALVESYRQVLKNSLRLLGIDVLEEM
jgi:arginyl-tRNA synthetase